MVLGPAWWLLLTEDGQRRTDAVMLWLFGHQAVDMALARLAPYEEPALLSLYDGLPWRCGRGDGRLGERRCAAPLGVFNGIPARSLTFYFRQGRLSAMKLVYRRRYHVALVRDLRRRLGTPVREAGVLRWRAGEGLLVAKARVTPADEAALIWITRDPPPGGA